MKFLIAFFSLLVCIFSFPCFAQTWRTEDILLNEEIQDWLIDDLNRDGRKDLLIIAGNFVCLFFQRESGFLRSSDQRIYYNLIGDIIDVGEVDPSSIGLELLGLSERGVKCFKNNGFHYMECSEYLVSQKVDIPEYKVEPLISDFAFDINSDGLDEIFLLRENKIEIYHRDNSGLFVSVPLEGSKKSTGASLRSRKIPSGSKKNPFFVFQPSILEEDSVFFQDFNEDGRLDHLSKTLRLQEAGFSFRPVNYSIRGEEAVAGPEEANFYLDIDGDGSLDLVLLQAKGMFKENINIFPFAKIFIYRRQKDGNFAQKPDFFQKTILISDHSPFVDVDRDDDLDFISIWSEITPGSKKDIIQALLESTLSFTFRCYLFDKKKGYSAMPDIQLQAKIKQHVSQMAWENPFDFSGDFDGNGSNDLLIKKEPDSYYLYLFDQKKKNHIISVKRLPIPVGCRSHQVVDLDENGKSDILLFMDKKIRLLSF